MKKDERRHHAQRNLDSKFVKFGNFFQQDETFPLVARYKSELE